MQLKNEYVKPAKISQSMEDCLCTLAFNVTF